MTVNNNARALARAAALAVVGVLAACSNGTGSVTPPAQNFSAISPVAQGGAAAVRRAGGGSCPSYTNSQSFNNTPIAAGSWIWFSSVFNVPGISGALRFHMAHSKITFTANSQTYTIDVPGTRTSLHTKPNLHINYAAKNSIWWLMAPYDTQSNDFLTGVAWQAPADLPGGIDNVTWTASFYSGKNSANTHVQWRWGAAVYTTFTNDYNGLGVKPLDDDNYPPYNKDNAGTPENYTAYVTDGGTGHNGSYTGDLGPTVNVYTCIPK